MAGRAAAAARTAAAGDMDRSRVLLDRKCARTNYRVTGAPVVRRTPTVTPHHPVGQSVHCELRIARSRWRGEAGELRRRQALDVIWKQHSLVSGGGRGVNAH